VHVNKEPHAATIIKVKGKLLSISQTGVIAMILARLQDISDTNKAAQFEAIARFTTRQYVRLPTLAARERSGSSTCIDAFNVHPKIDSWPKIYF